MYWYILFVMTSRERKVEQFLIERLDSNFFVPFVPLCEKLFKNSGIVKKELQPLFPGYVFIESQVSNQKFIKKINAIIYTYPDVVRILRYSDTEFAMKESERQMLLSLCNNDYCIKSSSGIIEGDKIYITDGPLKGRESMVKKINRHKRQASIEMEFMGDTRLVRVSLEIMNKIV